MIKIKKIINSEQGDKISKSFPHKSLLFCHQQKNKKEIGKDENEEKYIKTHIRRVNKNKRKKLIQSSDIKLKYCLEKKKDRNTEKIKINGHDAGECSSALHERRPLAQPVIHQKKS